MKQLTIYKLTFWTVMCFLKKNDLLYCYEYDISLENFTESTFFTFFPPPSLACWPSSLGCLLACWLAGWLACLTLQN